MPSSKNNRVKKCVLANERGAQVFAPGSRRSFALLYPNNYHIGMSNLGLHILYREINARGDTSCERFFLPETGEKLLSRETKRPLGTFSVIGVMMSFELDYFNFLTMLEAGRVPLYSEKRSERDPLVIIGGPCATFNPEPLSLFADAFVIGEGEETINDILDAIKDDASLRREKLARLGTIPGVYVPSLYQAEYSADGKQTALLSLGGPSAIKRRWVQDIDKYAGHYEIISNATEFGNMFAVEVARGCGRHCRFCMAGYCFRQPRPRSLEKIWQAIEQRPAEADRVGLLGAAVSDYPQIKELVARLIAFGIAFSVSSIRADMLDVELAHALAQSGQKTLTIAPEAGSERLCRIINKGVTEEDILRCVRLAAEAGMSQIKLYFMIGLPGETQDDIEELAALVFKVRKEMDAVGNKGKLSLSVNPFIPKPCTPFQWENMLEEKELKIRLSYLQEAFKKHRNIDIFAESLRSSRVQAALARGGRSMGKELLAAHHEGGMKTFAATLRKTALDSYQPGDYLPWQHLDMGFSLQYLLDEREKALLGLPAAVCVDGCRRCGVCED